MKHLKRFIERLDDFQRRHKFVAFCFAVIKKYSEDQMGNQAALLTYYAFMSLFPLLLVLATVTQLVVLHNAQLENSILHGATSYFPVLGNQLATHIHSLHKNGLALLIGTVIILYGARGVADVFRRGVNRVWYRSSSSGMNIFESAWVSMKIICAGGIGLVVAAISAGLAATAGHGLVFRLLSICISAFILFWIFMYLLRLSLLPKTPFRELRLAASCAVIGLIVLQIVGGFILIHVLKNLDALYSIFATTLGLIFWLYLQAQAIYYAIEIAATHEKLLWPRSLSGNRRTSADERATAKIRY
jgi:membrane protein